MLVFKKPNDRGFIPVLVLIAVLGVVTFLGVSSLVDFKQGVFSNLFKNSLTHAATAATVAADIDLSSKVDIFDYNQLLADFNCSSGNCLKSDIISNNKVDIFDYNAMLVDFNKSSVVKVLYNEGLPADLGNNSWGSTLNYNDTTNPYLGSQNIVFSPTVAYGGLRPQFLTNFSTSGYDTVTLAIKPTQPLIKLTLNAYDGTGAEIAGSKIQLSNYGGDPIAGFYKVYKIPLSDLKAYNMTIKSFALQDATGANPPTYSLFIDRYALINTGLTPPPSATPTPAPTPISTNLYTDSLATGWSATSWNSTYGLTDTHPNTGTSNIIWNPNDLATVYGGFQIYQLAGFSLIPYDSLKFSLQAATASPNLQVWLTDKATDTALTKVNLTNYGGQPVVGSYKTYVIPLSDLGAVGKTISYFNLQDLSGLATAPTIYIDNVSFTGPVGGQTPAPTPIPTSPPAQGNLPAYPFTYTLAPGSTLPTDDQCLAVMNSHRNPSFEPVPKNSVMNNRNAKVGYNRLDGTFHKLQTPFQNDWIDGWSTTIDNRISGNFTGTTDEIMQWAACKWGFNADDIRAESVTETNWFQAFVGDCDGDITSETTGCESIGIIQNRALAANTNTAKIWTGSYPMILDSTALNLDYAMGMRRLCYEGYEGWLKTYGPNGVEADTGYRAGNLWGCIGKWQRGHWPKNNNTSSPDSTWTPYMAKVYEYMVAKEWLKAYFPPVNSDGSCPDWTPPFTNNVAAAHCVYK